MTRLNINLTAAQIDQIISWSIDNDRCNKEITTSATLTLDAELDISTCIVYESKMNFETK